MRHRVVASTVTRELHYVQGDERRMHSRKLRRSVNPKIIGNQASVTMVTMVTVVVSAKYLCASPGRKQISLVSCRNNGAGRRFASSSRRDKVGAGH